MFAPEFQEDLNFVLFIIIFYVFNYFDVMISKVILKKQKQMLF